MESWTKLKICISGIRLWIIKNQFKINDLKTKFRIFKSPLMKQNLSDLYISVLDTVRYLVLGVPNQP